MWYNGVLAMGLTIERTVVMISTIAKGRSVTGDREDRTLQPTNKLNPDTASHIATRSGNFNSG